MQSRLQSSPQVAAAPPLRKAYPCLRKKSAMPWRNKETLSTPQRYHTAGLIALTLLKLKRRQSSQPSARAVCHTRPAERSAKP